MVNNVACSIIVHSLLLPLSPEHHSMCPTPKVKWSCTRCGMLVVHVTTSAKQIQVSILSTSVIQEYYDLRE